MRAYQQIGEAGSRKIRLFAPIGCSEPARCTNVPAASVLGVESIGVERNNHPGGLWFVLLQAGLVILPAGDLDNTRGDLFFVYLSRRSKILRPLLSRKNVCSPNICLKAGIAG